MASEDSTPKTGGSLADRVTLPEQPEQPQQPEKPEQPEQLKQPEKPEKPEGTRFLALFPCQFYGLRICYR